MALPLVLGAVKVIPLLVVLARWVVAFFSMAEHVLKVCWLWLQTHKIVFSLFMAGVWVALWWGLVQLLTWLAGRYVSGLIWSALPELSFLREGLSFISTFIDLGKFKTTVSLLFSMFTGEMVVMNYLKARWMALQFFNSLANTFRV